MAKKYKYSHPYVDESGTMVTEDRVEDLDQLKERYWQKWCDQRTIMKMGISEKDFINDMKTIFKMEEVK